MPPVPRTAASRSCWGSGPHFAYVQQPTSPLKALTRGLHELGLINLSPIAAKKLKMVTPGVIKGMRRGPNDVSKRGTILLRV
jgi:hypothetical protein